MKTTVDTQALDNLNESLKFIIEDDHTEITTSVIIQLSKNITHRVSKFEYEKNSRLTRVLRRFENERTVDKTKLPETLAALKKLLSSDYFEKLEKELECDKIGIIIDPSGDSVNICSGRRRNKFVTKFLFWVRRKFVIDVKFDEIYYSWTYYADFSSERGIETSEQLKSLMQASDDEYEKKIPKSSQEILNETLGEK